MFPYLEEAGLAGSGILVVCIMKSVAATKAVECTIMEIPAYNGLALGKPVLGRQDPYVEL